MVSEGADTPDPPIRVLLVDDHAVVRKGMRALLDRETGIDVVGEADDGEQAVRGADRLRPDVILMDLEMPGMGGIDATRRISQSHPESRIVVLTSHAAEEDVFPALKAGAQAYLLKTTLNTELRQTIRAVHAGRKALSPEVSYELAEHATDDALTAAEIRVLRLIAAGKANKEIAAQLSLSEETVKGQVSKILSKLGVSDRTQAVMIGLKRGIIEL